MADAFETELFNRATGMRLRVLESPQTTQSPDLVWKRPIGRAVLGLRRIFTLCRKNISRFWRAR